MELRFMFQTNLNLFDYSQLSAVGVAELLVAPGAATHTNPQGPARDERIGTG